MPTLRHFVGSDQVCRCLLRLVYVTKSKEFSLPMYVYRSPGYSSVDGETVLRLPYVDKHVSFTEHAPRGSGVEYDL